MSRLKRHCLTCGALTTSTRCPTCANTRHQEAYGGDWEAIRQQVLVRDHHECRLRLPGCTGTATTVDHVVAVANGGGRHPDNLQAACMPCNTRKGNRW